MKNKFINIFGKVFTVICVAFVVYKLLSYDIDYSIVLNQYVLVSCIVSIAILSLPVFINSIAYIKILNIISIAKISKKEVKDIYISSNIGKYMPGNVMHFIGRNILGSKYGLSNKNLGFATVLEVGIKVIVSIVGSSALSYGYLVKAIDESFSKYFFIIIIFIIVVIVALLFYFGIRNRNEINISKILKNILIVLIFDVLIFIMNIVCFLIIFWAISGSNILLNSSLLTISGIYMVSWLIGYITPGAPGGLGVKEAVMVFLLVGIISEEYILLTAIVLRFCNIIGDFIAFFMNKILNKSTKKNITGESK